MVRGRVIMPAIVGIQPSDSEGALRKVRKVCKVCKDSKDSEGSYCKDCKDCKDPIVRYEV